MYERMLCKEIQPSLADMYDVIGEEGSELLLELDEFLRQNYAMVAFFTDSF